MQRIKIKRVFAVSAVTALTAASVPAIAAAAPSTGSGSGSGGVTPQQVCAGIAAIHNVLGLGLVSMDKGSAAAIVLGAAVDATFDLGDKICAG